jgi:hypothetical protein
MLRKKTKENIKKFDKEQYKIRFRQNSDENPQKEETSVTKNNGVGNNDKK